jgi:D-3-phosphoglycerate dehydrogenase
VCTPHLGASTTEAQEGVSTEVAEAVVDALQGKLAATAVNAPMVSAEVLKELAPFVTLAEALGKVRRHTGGGGGGDNAGGGGTGVLATALLAVVF